MLYNSIYIIHLKTNNGNYCAHWPFVEKKETWLFAFQANKNRNTFECDAKYTYTKWKSPFRTKSHISICILQKRKMIDLSDVSFHLFSFWFFSELIGCTRTYNGLDVVNIFFGTRQFISWWQFPVELDENKLYEIYLKRFVTNLVGPHAVNFSFWFRSVDFSFDIILKARGQIIFPFFTTLNNNWRIALKFICIWCRSVVSFKCWLFIFACVCVCVWSVMLNAHPNRSGIHRGIVLIQFEISQSKFYIISIGSVD